MRQYGAGNRFGWPNYRALGAEAVLKLLPEALEELDVFCFFAGKLKQRADALVIPLKLRPGMIQNERQNELFHESENAQVSVASDLIENPLLVAR